MRLHLCPLKWWLLLVLGAVMLPCATLPRAVCAQDAEAELAEPAADEPTTDEAMTEEPAIADDGAIEEQPAEDEAPARKPAAKPKRKPGQDDEEAVAPPPPSPAVEAVLESHPQTPAELVRAIDILVALGEAKLADGFVDELAKRKLELAEKAALAARFNSARLMRLAAQPDLAAKLGPVIDDWFKAAAEYRTDAKRLAGWAAQLGDADEDVQAQAAHALLHAREAAVTPLVNVLADAKQRNQWPLVKTVLVRLGDLAVEPLLGVLECHDAALKTQVVEVLGQLHDERTVPALLATLVSPASSAELKQAAAAALAKVTDQTPNAQQAVRSLQSAAQAALDRSRSDSDDGPQRTLWHWNAKRHQSMPITYDTTGASLAEAVRLARALYELDPNDAARKRFYLTALLQSAKFRLGLNRPLPAGAGTARGVAERYGAQAVEEVLAGAMSKGYLPAATAAAEILGDIGDAAELTVGGATPRPLALAAGSSDRRLRFAAMDAILKLNPTGPFAGSSYVADALGFFASSYGTPRVLIVHPRSDEAQKIAGLVAGLGFETDTATNGRAAFEQAVSSPDYVYILVHSAIDRPRVDELAAQLRRDRRTAALPLGFVAPLDDLDRVARFAREVPLAMAFLQPQKPEEMKLYSEQLTAAAGRDQTSPAERKAEALAALKWMAKLSEQSSGVFDIRRQEAAVTRVLLVPELSEEAAQVLGQLGTASSQRSLLDLAALAAQPLAVRQAAAAAFARSVRKFGILLSRDQILAQYDLYNTNAGRNADTHAVMTTVLDALERKGDSASSP